jgi:hypothetical protein
LGRLRHNTGKLKCAKNRDENAKRIETGQIPCSSDNLRELRASEHQKLVIPAKAGT